MWNVNCLNQKFSVSWQSLDLYLLLGTLTEKLYTGESEVKKAGHFINVRCRKDGNTSACPSDVFQIFSVRFVSCCWNRCWWPSSLMHTQDEFCEGLGTGLPKTEHQRNALLDWDSLTPGSPAPRWSSSHHAYCGPTTFRLRSFTVGAHNILCQDGGL